MQLSVLTCFVLHCFVSLYPVHLMHGFALVYIYIYMYIYIEREANIDRAP